ncbi:hypothetical protein LBMAG42_43900 [Deltaproteobacteria bacterium]|nr:hypothetical protein LBMAG42_43900 [Deltaproteobacteria bacterium]
MRAMLLVRMAPVAVALACSDYGLNEEKAPTPLDAPAITVDPGDIVATGLCAPTERDVLIQNEGEGRLEITAIEVEGTGWTITSSPALPLDLASGESTLVSLEGTDGDGRLVVSSNDGDDPKESVSLRAVANTPPSATISAPLPSEVLPEGVDYTLVGLVADAEDDLEDLVVTWSGSVDGALDTSGPQPDGTTSHLWAAAARTSGPQSVALEVTDSCGETAMATVDMCQDGANTYDALSLSSWHYEGSAAWDGGAANLLLTPATQDQVGSAFETSAPVNADNVDIAFYVYVGGGTGADGLSLTALDVSRATGFLGGTGCGIGYGGSADCTTGPALPGWTLEIDTYYNGGVDPTADDHLAFTFDGDVDAYQAWATLPEMEDTGWHYVEVSVVAPHVTVAVDGSVYIDQDIPGNYSFSAYVGFTAGTGGETNEHRVDELTVTDYSCG